MRHRGRALRHRYGRTAQAGMAKFKDLVNGSFFKFVAEDAPDMPSATYVKLGPRSYASPLTPTRDNVRGGDPTRRYKTAPASTVRLVEPYATHAFPEAGSDWWPKP